MSTTYSQLQEIPASDGQSGDFFSASITLSMYGDVALVGRPGFSDGVGSVSVFRQRQSDESWDDQFEIIANDPTVGAVFGSSIALSTQGYVAVIGAPRNSAGGSAYIFIDSDAVWTQVQKIVSSDITNGDQFGISVATSAQGNTILVGARHARIGSNSQQGAAYIFQLHDISDWIQQQKIYANDGNASDNFGAAVALSENSDLALIGAPGGSCAYIFERIGATWSDRQKLQSGGVGDGFGKSVALSIDGEIALVGAPFYNANQGAAYVYAHSDGMWALQLRLLVSDSISNALFGSSVALGENPDGNITVLIGAPGSNKSYIFKRANNVWSQSQQIVASDGGFSDNFGTAVALTGDGLIGLIGAPAFSDTRGSAYFFGAQPLVTLADTSSLIAFLPDILIGAIALYVGIMGLFLLYASEE